MRLDRGSLHTAPVLPANFEQSFSDLTQRANARCGHQLSKHVLVVNRSLLERGECLLCLIFVALVEIGEAL
jgi:hypothetical protein